MTRSHTSTIRTANIHSTFISTGALAIITGGVISAFCAKHPSTLAMWVSAYLVLAVGIVQVFFGTATVKLIKNNATRSLLWVFVLFNIGNILVIASTLLKYSGHSVLVMTILGSLLIVGALGILIWCIRTVKWSWLKVSLLAVAITLGSSSIIGVLLAAMK